MGRHRKPVADHLRDGTYRPGRHGPVPDPEPAADPPAKPEDLGGEAGAFWDRVVGLLGPVLRPADAPQLVQMAKWWARWAEVEVALAGGGEIPPSVPGTIQHTRLINAASTCSANFDRVASRFGLTPADRARLRAEATTATRAKVATRPATTLDRAGPPATPGKRKQR